MQTHSSLRKQNAQWFALQKEAMRKELLHAKPHDYQDRNWFYQIVAIVISYPLQTISILAGAYLLFDVASFVWQLPSYSWASLAVFVGCMAIFLLIELLRRWLVDTVGFHYLATFYVQAGELVRGEWLRTKIVLVFCISLILVSTGTFGAYQYSKNHAPQANIVNISLATSPLLSQIKTEKQHIELLNKNITDLQQNKKRELADPKSYAVWEGKEYLLPEVKTRHQNYDAQIAQTQRQAQTHLELLQKYEQKLSSKEQSLEQINQETTTINRLSKEQYAFASASIWLVFESLLLLSLGYVWVYRYGVKREILLEQTQSISKRSHNAQPSKTVAQNDKRFSNQSTVSKATVTDFSATVTVPKIGFVVGKKTVGTVRNGHNNTENDLETVTVPVETVEQTCAEHTAETEGFPIVCRNCGTHIVMRSPRAIFCSNKCRTEHFKKSNR